MIGFNATLRNSDMSLMTIGFWCEHYKCPMISSHRWRLNSFAQSQLELDSSSARDSEEIHTLASDRDPFTTLIQ